MSACLRTVCPLCHRRREIDRDRERDTQRNKVRLAARSCISMPLWRIYIYNTGSYVPAALHVRSLLPLATKTLLHDKRSTTVPLRSHWVSHFIEIATAPLVLFLDFEFWIQSIQCFSITMIWEKTPTTHSIVFALRWANSFVRLNEMVVRLLHNQNPGARYSFMAEYGIAFICISFRGGLSKSMTSWPSPRHSMRGKFQGQMRSWTDP